MIAHLRGRERALATFGLTGRRAEWIALASLHGGVFTRAQLSDWLRASRFKVLRLVQAWTERRLVAEETVGGLMTVLNWAARSRDEEGNLLLDSNPLKGLRKPREKNPNRVVLTEDEYRALLGVSRQVGWRFHVALVLAHETGHRIGAIRKLTWSDIDFDGKTIRWRAEHEKTGYEHITPLTAEALAVLEEARRKSRGTGNAPVLPSPRDAMKWISRVCAHNWWKKAQTFARLEPMPGRGWHALRRKFATDLMDLPLKVLCELGGWKSPQTVLRCYQQADAGQLRTALESRPRART